MKGPEVKKQGSKLEDEALVQKIREIFAEEIDDGIRKGHYRLPSDTAEKVICGEKIKSNFQLRDALSIIARGGDFHLNQDEIEELADLIFEK